MKVTLFVPVRNEITGIRQIMPKIRREWVDEILVVDGGSTDGTLEFLRSEGLRVVVQEERGRGVAFRIGVREARGEHVVFYSLDGNEDYVQVGQDGKYSFILPGAGTYTIRVIPPIKGMTYTVPVAKKYRLTFKTGTV